MDYKEHNKIKKDQISRTLFKKDSPILLLLLYVSAKLHKMKYTRVFQTAENNERRLLNCGY